MEEIQVGAMWLTLKPLTSKWHTWYYSLRDLLHKAKKINADWGVEIVFFLKVDKVPESWNGCNLIFPLTTKRKWKGLLWRRVVAVSRVVGEELLIEERFLCDGFGPKDFLVSVRLLGEK